METRQPFMKAAGMLTSVCAVVALGATTAIAKRATIGIYGIVDRVEFEPSDDAPERILIWGAFVVPVPMSSGKYKSPQRGHLYFKIRPGMEQVVKQDWAELKVLAGSRRAVGFGQYWVPNPSDASGNPHHSLVVTVRDDAEGESPDVYPLPHARGIVKTGDLADPDFDQIIVQLQNVAARDLAAPTSLTAAAATR